MSIDFLEPKDNRKESDSISNISLLWLTLFISKLIINCLSLFIRLIFPDLCTVNIIWFVVFLLGINLLNCNDICQ